MVVLLKVLSPRRHLQGSQTRLAVARGRRIRERHSNEARAQDRQRHEPGWATFRGGALFQSRCQSPYPLRLRLPQTGRDSRKNAWPALTNTFPIGSIKWHLGPVGGVTVIFCRCDAHRQRGHPAALRRSQTGNSLAKPDRRRNGRGSQFGAHPGNRDCEGSSRPGCR